MRILVLVLVLFSCASSQASAHGWYAGRDCCSYRSGRWCGDGCGWAAHRRWYRHAHHRHGHGHHCGAGCHHHGDVHVHGPSLTAFPPHPVDGQEVFVDGHKWEYDADENRWELD